jgi:Cof subfamily protein (haloacid dehalogenase superfamily)
VTTTGGRVPPRRVALVVSDVDGTLLEHDGRLPADRRAAVRRLTAAGIPLVMATGKLWSSIRSLWEDLELPGPHVTCNGAAVVAADGRLLHLDLLASEVADDLVAVMRSRDLPYAVYLEDGSLITDRLRPEHDVLPVLGEPVPTTGPREDRGVIKVLCLVDAAREGDLRRFAADRARIQRTGVRFLEWNSPTADKATGLGHVLTTLGVAMEEVVAIGDAENDVPMLRAAGLGIAVLDASTAAVTAADRQLTTDLAEYLTDLAATVATSAATR